VPADFPSSGITGSDAAIPFDPRDESTVMPTAHSLNPPRPPFFQRDIVLSARRFRGCGDVRGRTSLDKKSRWK